MLLLSASSKCSSWTVLPCYGWLLYTLTIVRQMPHLFQDSRDAIAVVINRLTRRTFHNGNFPVITLTP